MPTLEHSLVVAKPLEYVASVLAMSDAESLFAPSIARITLDATEDGRAADLTYDQLRTRATMTAARADDSRERTASITAVFAGPGVEGTISYRLVPRDDGTELVQCVTYEFAEWAGIDLLEPATTAHNDKQFAAHLTTVAALIDAESQVLPTPGGAIESEPPVSTR